VKCIVTDSRALSCEAVTTARSSSRVGPIIDDLCAHKIRYRPTKQPVLSRGIHNYLTLTGKFTFKLIELKIWDEV